MRRKCVIPFSLFIGLLLSTGTGHAQYSFYNKPKFEKWVQTGAGHFFGDLGGKQKNGLTIAGNEEFDLTNLRPTIGAGVRLNVNRWFALRGSLTYAFFKQSDANSERISQQKRNLSFQTHVIEATISSEFRVATFGIKTKNRQSFWEYYVFAGAGGFYYNPKAVYEDNLVALRPLSTEGQGLKPGTQPYKSVAGCFPIGGGLRFGTGFNSSFSLELGYRVTTTDFLDDVSGNYYSYGSLLDSKGKTSADLSYRGSDPLYPTGRTRGNPFNKDSYLMINIGFSTALKGRRLTRFHGR